MYQHWAEADQSEQYREADHILSDWARLSELCPWLFCTGTYAWLFIFTWTSHRIKAIGKWFPAENTVSEPLPLPGVHWLGRSQRICVAGVVWGVGFFGGVCSMRRVNEAVAVGGQVPYQMQMGKLWTASHSGIFTDSTESSRKFLCVCAHKCAHMNTQCINACHT